MRRLYPEIFEMPSDEELKKLAVGDYVQVCAAVRPLIQDSEGKQVSGERFWAHILAIWTDGAFIAEVGNKLVYSRYHGIYLGDRIIFHTRHVYNIMPRSWWALPKQA
jgi:hypothetical protein